MPPWASKTASASLITIWARVSLLSRAWPPAWSRWAWLLSKILMSSNLIAEFAHTLADRGDGRLKPAVNQDVTVARGDEERRDVRGTHVVDVADHPERLERAVHQPKGRLNLLFGDGSSELTETGTSLLPPDPRSAKPPAIAMTESMIPFACIFSALAPTSPSRLVSLIAFP